ncbi:hypothetical protein GCM10010207_80750 [Streptomyces atratus]|nr:hypothetical protein GCM10010207_80750 [Streptomyces atratus]
MIDEATVAAGIGSVWSGAQQRKDRSRFLLAATGGDGHHTVLSSAEIDADFGNVPVLLATRMDNQELDTVGSRLVAPADRCSARCISAITRVWVGAWATPGQNGIVSHSKIRPQPGKSPST